MNRGVRLSPGSVALADRWYSGYFRVATNEKGVVRSYLSTGDAAFGRELERRTRELLEQTVRRAGDRLISFAAKDWLRNQSVSR